MGIVDKLSNSHEKVSRIIEGLGNHNHGGKHIPEDFNVNSAKNGNTTSRSSNETINDEMIDPLSAIKNFSIK